MQMCVRRQIYAMCMHVHVCILNDLLGRVPAGEGKIWKADECKCVHECQCCRCVSMCVGSM